MLSRGSDCDNREKIKDRMGIQIYRPRVELGHVSRVTQIQNLLLLAPDIHEALLFLPRPNGAGTPCTSVSSSG
jgi:hypothetical protein